MTELSDMDLIKELFRIRTEYRLREIDIAKVVGGTQSSVNRWMQAASNPAEPMTLRPNSRERIKYFLTTFRDCQGKPVTDVRDLRRRLSRLLPDLTSDSLMKAIGISEESAVGLISGKRVWDHSTLADLCVAFDIEPSSLTKDNAMLPLVKNEVNQALHRFYPVRSCSMVGKVISPIDFEDFPVILHAAGPYRFYILAQDYDRYPAGSWVMTNLKKNKVSLYFTSSGLSPTASQPAEPVESITLRL